MVTPSPSTTLLLYVGEGQGEWNVANPALSMQRSTGQRPRPTGTFARVAQYTLVRAITVFITVIVGVYLTVIVANMGGKVDEIRKADIRFEVSMAAAQNEALRDLSRVEYNEYVAQLISLEERRVGLDKPFYVRSFTYLTNAVTLNLGRAEYLHSDSGSSEVRAIILERLFPTLLLFATAQVFLFVIGLFVALYLSRRYGSWLDKLIIALAPTSSAPSWFAGIFLILLFASVWGVLPFGGMVAAPPPANMWAYALSVMKHLILPVSASVISSVFLSIYNWRTFFLIYSSEDYVEMAKAKGLSSGQIERRYVLRPTLPTIVTSLALTMISLWTGSIILETVFGWPGLGRLIYQAINVYDTPVIVGTTVIYAYLLGLTVFLLDVIYALVDPRVKVGSGGRSA